MSVDDALRMRSLHRLTRLIADELLDNIHSGLTRPGSWEWPWLRQAISQEEIDELIDLFGDELGDLP